MNKLNPTCWYWVSFYVKKLKAFQKHFVNWLNILWKQHELHWWDAPQSTSVVAICLEIGHIDVRDSEMNNNKKKSDSLHFLSYISVFESKGHIAPFTLTFVYYSIRLCPLGIMEFRFAGFSWPTYCTVAGLSGPAYLENTVVLLWRSCC